MKLPTNIQIEKLHKKYAPTDRAFNLVFTHSTIVKDIAEQIITKRSLDINSKLVNVGALLHDIGVYSIINIEGELDESNYIQHGIRGYNILKQEGFSENICRFTERHTGVGISQNDVISQNLNIPPKDYTAESLEEKLIMYSDKFHSKNQQFNSFDTYSKYIGRFGKDKVQKFNLLSQLFGTPDLELLARKYKHPIL